MSETRLWTKKTWPSRSSSRRIASTTAGSLYSPTCVRIGRRSAGGVVIIERSRIPTKAISRVRGIGLALRVKTSTPMERDLIASLCVTPNRCSSSTTSRPRSLKATFSESNRCVPMTTSTLPSRSPASVSLVSASSTKRLSIVTFTGNPAKRSLKVAKCWLASSVVGTSTAACLPSWTALKTARIATSVLPKPTSAQTSRSIGRAQLHVGLHVLDRLGLVGGQA